MRVMLKGLVFGIICRLVLLAGDGFFYVIMQRHGFLDGKLETIFSYWIWLSNPLSLLYQMACVHRTVSEDGTAMAYITRVDSVMIYLTSWLFYPVVMMVGFLLLSRRRTRGAQE